MKLKKKKPRINQVLSTCCWCGLKIKADSPIYSIGCKKRPEVNIAKYEGKVMSVQILSSDKSFGLSFLQLVQRLVKMEMILCLQYVQKNVGLN